LTKEWASLRDLKTKRLGELGKSECYRSWQKRHLMGVCGLVQKAKQRATCLTEEEEIQLVGKGWQCFDHLMYTVAAGSNEELSKYVFNPERFSVKRKETTMSFSDQIPVWLKAAPDKALVSKTIADERRLAERARTSRLKIAAGVPQTAEAELQPRTTVTAPGNPANSRYRITLVARQLLFDYFDESKEPRGWLRKQATEQICFTQLSPVGRLTRAGRARGSVHTQ